MKYRIVHSFFVRNESPSLPKLLKKLKEEINFPYSTPTLHLLLKKLGFRWYKVRRRDSIIREREDLVNWREAFLRRIKEIREKEPDQ